MPTPLQRSFASWLTRFDTICLAYGGVRDSKWGEHSFLIETPSYGQLRASVHASDYNGQKKRGFVQIYLMFATFDTGKIYDRLGGADFNGCSGKWNISLSGTELDRTRDMAIHELTRRLEFCGAKVKNES